MNLDSTYTINERDVIAESLQGETLIINLISGIYYSTDGIGDEIWRFLRDGSSVSQVVETLSARYVGDPAVIRDDVIAFVAQLCTEDLIREGDAPATTATGPITGSDGAPAFVKPVLQRYTDYQELLLLDPVHEVDDASGWPVARPDART
jgi:hypothetical protein